jgi:hypothetical protein
MVVAGQRTEQNSEIGLTGLGNPHENLLHALQNRPEFRFRFPLLAQGNFQRVNVDILRRCNAWACGHGRFPGLL